MLVSLSLYRFFSFIFGLQPEPDGEHLNWCSTRLVSPLECLFFRARGVSSVLRVLPFCALTRWRRTTVHHPSRVGSRYLCGKQKYRLFLFTALRLPLLLFLLDSPLHPPPTKILLNLPITLYNIIIFILLPKSSISRCCLPCINLVCVSRPEITRFPCQFPVLIVFFSSSNEKCSSRILLLI